MMNRREAVRLLATAVAMPLLPVNAMAILREARAGLGPSSALRTLDGHQEATVRTMAEMILPRTDTPGATDVGATEFIDLMLTEWYDADARNRFLSGLTDVDARSQSLFGKNFVDCPAVQQSEILIALGEKMAAENPPSPDQARPRRGSAPRKEENFYPMLRRLTLTAYYTSEAGATEELKFEIIPERHAGCVEQTGKEVSEKQ